MYNFIREKQKTVQIVLALVTLPFIFSGVDSWVTSIRRQEHVATVGDIKISNEVFQSELNQRLQSMRSSQADKFDLAKADTLELRKSVLDSIIDKYLLLNEAARQNFIVSNEAVREAIIKIPEFHDNGTFSSKRYEETLKAISKTPGQFENEIKESVLLQQLVGGIEGSSIYSKAVSTQIINQQLEERTVQLHSLNFANYFNQVKLADGAVKQYYDANLAKYEKKERVKVEFVVLNAANVEKDIKLTDDQLKAAYTANTAAYETPERRDASHILITYNGAGEKDKAKAKANELLQQIQTNPASFAEIAKAESKDPGSAAKGGDLGMFGRGDMVKPFEDAAYALNVGQISNVVESDFGFHIIKLNAIDGKKIKPFEQVRAQIENDKRRELGSKKFAEMAEGFDKTVFEQADSLASASSKFNLPIIQSDWIERDVNLPGEQLVLNNPEVRKAIFDTNAISKKLNSKALEVAPQTLVSLRVVDHLAKSITPLDEVKGQIEQTLNKEAASKLAKEAGEKLLAKLQEGQDNELSFTPAKTVRRVGEFAPEAIKAIYKVSSKKLPGYAGAISGDAYHIFKVSAVSQAKIPDEQHKAMLGQLENVMQQETVREYLAALKKRYKIETNLASIEKKEVSQ